jgi:polyhydroxybutyrate depolymerase
MTPALRLLVVALLAGCGGSVDHPVFGAIPTGAIDFEHDGGTRQYAVHVPTDVGEGAPLLLAMHGYTDDALRLREYTGLNAVADAHGFVVAYPRGSRDAMLQRFWNMGYAFHEGETVDDVGFLAALAGHLQATYGADPDRTFTTGFSNGGDMSYLLACRRPEVFRGFASVGGLMLSSLQDDCPFVDATPVLEIRGRADDITRYAGDPDDADGWGSYPPVEDTMDFWQARNGCSERSDERLDAEDSVQLTRWHGCTDGVEVQLLAIDDFGHEWPEATGDFGFDASEAVWGFLSGF